MPQGKQRKSRGGLRGHREPDRASGDFRTHRWVTLGERAMVISRKCRSGGGARACAPASSATDRSVPLLVSSLSLHEFARVILKLRAQLGVLFEEGTEGGMVLEILPIVNQPWLAHELPANVGMAVEEPIETRQLRVPDILGGKISAIDLKMPLARHEIHRVGMERLGCGGMIFQPLLDFFVVLQEIRLIGDESCWPPKD